TLAVRGIVRILAHFQAPRGQLPQEPARRVPVLPHEQHPPIVVHGHEHDRAVMPDDLEIGLATVRQPDAIDGHVEDPALVDESAGEDGSGLAHWPTVAAAAVRTLAP